MNDTISCGSIDDIYYTHTLQQQPQQLLKKKLMMDISYVATTLKIVNIDRLWRSGLYFWDMESEEFLKNFPDCKGYVMSLEISFANDSILF